jgi:hypothetical protein
LRYGQLEYPQEVTACDLADLIRVESTFSIASTTVL